MTALKQKIIILTYKLTVENINIFFLCLQQYDQPIDVSYHFFPLLVNIELN